MISSAFIMYFKFLSVRDYISWQAIKLNLITTPTIIHVISSSSSYNYCHCTCVDCFVLAYKLHYSMPTPAFLVVFMPTLSIFCYIHYVSCHLACPPGLCFPFIAVYLHLYLSCCQNNSLHFPRIVHGHNTTLNVTKSPHI